MPLKLISFHWAYFVEPFRKSFIRFASASRPKVFSFCCNPQLQKSNTELADSNRSTNENMDKLARAQHEMLKRTRKADETIRMLETEKEALEKAHASSNNKLTTQEKQLRTFLEANEALEVDLRKQMQRVAALEKRKLEQEAEQQTIEAYYQVLLCMCSNVLRAYGVFHCSTMLEMFEPCL